MGIVLMVNRNYDTSLGCLFFFQAEDGIRDKLVTGVQTCALPICRTHQRLQPSCRHWRGAGARFFKRNNRKRDQKSRKRFRTLPKDRSWAALRGDRSEEHTSELQSLAYLVCRLLLEKKKTRKSDSSIYEIIYEYT